MDKTKKHEKNFLKDPTICYLQKPHFRHRAHTDWMKKFNAKSSIKRAEVAMLILAKTNFK